MGAERSDAGRGAGRARGMGAELGRVLRVLRALVARLLRGKATEFRHCAP